MERDNEQQKMHSNHSSPRARASLLGRSLRGSRATTSVLAWFFADELHPARGPYLPPSFSPPSPLPPFVCLYTCPPCVSTQHARRVYIHYGRECSFALSTHSALVWLRVSVSTRDVYGVRSSQGSSLVGTTYSQPKSRNPNILKFLGSGNRNAQTPSPPTKVPGPKSEYLKKTPPRRSEKNPNTNTHQT